MSEFKAPIGVKWNAGGHSGVAQFGDDSQLLVMFYNRSVPNGAKSNAKGRPIHEDQIYIKIQHPGETLNIIDRPIREEDKARFSRQWSAFVHDRTQVPEGTSIDLLFPNHPAVAENLRGYGVFTIEQCAALSANAIDTIGRGAQEYVNRAKKYLDSSNKGQAFHQLQAEIDELRQEVRVRDNQIAQLKAQLDSIVGKLSDPVRTSKQPPFIPGYDAQTERINANAPTKELAETKKKSKRVPTVEDKITDPFAGKLAENNLDISMTEGQDA